MRRLYICLLLGLLALAPLGCAELTTEESARLPGAKELLQRAPERIRILTEAATSLYRRGESMAVEISQIKARIDSGEFSGVELVALSTKLLELVGQRQEILADAKEIKVQVSALGAELGQAKDFLKDVTKRSWLAGLRTAGEMLGALIVAALGVGAARKASQARSMASEVAHTKLALDICTETIEGLPALAAGVSNSAVAKGKVRSKVLPMPDVVKGILHASAKRAERGLARVV